MKKLLVTSIILVIAFAAKAQVTITTNTPTTATTTITTTSPAAALALYPTFVGYNTVRRITKSQLLLVKTLDVTDPKYKVSSFTMTFAHDGMNKKEVTSTSNELTPQMFDSIKSLIAGDKVYFENIKVNVNDEIRSLSPLFVNVVE